MSKFIKFSLFLVVVLLSAYIGSNVYHYFFDMGYPVIAIQGLENNRYYHGNIACTLQGNDSYKIGEISVDLDETPLLKHHRINARTFAHPLTISTDTLTNGKHTLTFHAVNGTRAGHETSQKYEFFVDNEPLRASIIKHDPEFKVMQGRTVHVKIQVNKTIKEGIAHAFNNENICFAASPNSTIYECFIPVNCEEKPDTYALNIVLKDHVENSITLADSITVAAAQFRKQQLSVDSEKIKREKELSMSNDKLEEALERLTKNSPQEKLWQGTFYAPTEIKGISTEYGAIRVTQEKGRYYHKAVDIIGTPKTIIWAPQSGMVVLKERFALSGNTVVLDHGFGIFSLFFHLDDFAPNIMEGSKLKQGNPIGTLGKTGYASGYHLHWEMRINNIAVDPLQWTASHF